MIDWWRMPQNDSRALILIIAASQLSIEFTAGKFFNLSLKTFVAVSAPDTNPHDKRQTVTGIAGNENGDVVSELPSNNDSASGVIHG